MIRKTFLAAVALIAVAANVQAQKLSGLVLEPARIEVGQSVKATTNFEVSNGAVNCKVRVHFGDGATDDVAINQAKDVPLVVTHTYTKPGKLDFWVEGKGGNKCLGEDQHATLEVVAKPEAANALSKTEQETETKLHLISK